MAKKWTDKDLDNLKNKGFKVTEMSAPESENHLPQRGIKIIKISVQKKTIQIVLQALKSEKIFDDFVTELKFDKERKFRFDWAIPSLKIAIEYEGIFSDKSRHTTVSGFSTDCEKYNLAASLGWTVLRYTSKNYNQLEEDLRKIISA